MDIWLASHNDDETLYGAYTIMREKPLVVIVTDGYLHVPKGVQPEDRRQESIRAMLILEAPVVFLGLHDDNLKEYEIYTRLCNLKNIDKVYAPAVYEDGHKHHNMVGRVALELWGFKVGKYATYTMDNPVPQGNIEVVPSEEERLLKSLALKEYDSQLKLNKLYFDAVDGKSEWLIR